MGNFPVNATKRVILAMGTIGLLLLAPYPGIAQFRPAAALAERPDASAIIFVARRGWHIDIGFAADDLAPPLKSLTADFPQVRYLFFGFGDRHYLMAKHQNFPVMLSALWPGPGMILATGLSVPPDAAFGAAHVVALRVTVAEARAAQLYVWDSLSKQSDAISIYADGPYQGSLYFKATPRYSALHTCNTWAAQVLKAGGLPIHSAGVVFAGQLWPQTRRASLSAEQRSGDSGAP